MKRVHPENGLIPRSKDAAGDYESAFETVSSKHLKELIPNYEKIRNGTLISKGMGIDKILVECPYFREWIEQISHLDT